jgi:hypothetical protein
VDVYQDGLRAAAHGRAAGWRVRYGDGAARPLALAATAGFDPGDRWWSASRWFTELRRR